MAQSSREKGQSSDPYGLTAGQCLLRQVRRRSPNLGVNPRPCQISLMRGSIVSRTNGSATMQGYRAERFLRGVLLLTYETAAHRNGEQRAPPIGRTNGTPEARAHPTNQRSSRDSGPDREGTTLIHRCVPPNRDVAPQFRGEGARIGATYLSQTGLPGSSHRAGFTRRRGPKGPGRQGCAEARASTGTWARYPLTTASDHPSVMACDVPRLTSGTSAWSHPS